MKIDKDWLYQKYVIEKLSTIKIGQLINRSPRLISFKLKRCGIRVRSTSESMQLISDQISRNSSANWNNTEYRDKIKCLNTIAYADINLRTMARNASIEYWKKDGSRQKASLLSKQYWSRRAFRINITRKLKSIWSRPERIRARRERAINLWNNKEYRDKVTKKIREITNTEDWKRELSIRSTEKWQNENYRQRMCEAMKKLHQNEEYKIKLAEARSKQKSCSSLEKVLASLLDELNIKFKKICIFVHEFDFLIERPGRKPLLVEINGDYYHDNNPHDKSKLTYYNKYLKDEYDFVIIKEHEFGLTNYLIEWIRNNLYIPAINIIFLNDVTFKEVSQKDYCEFYSKFHYIGNAGKWGYTLGAYYKDKLIACVTYSGCTRKETAERLGIGYRSVRELSRLCVHPLYKCENLLSKLISISIKNIKDKIPNLNYLVTFADTTQGHTGSIYKATNWIEDGTTSPSYHYEKNDCIAHKKTIWDNAKKMQLSEQEYADKYSFVKVPEACKIRYMYKLK